MNHKQNAMRGVYITVPPMARARARGGPWYCGGAVARAAADPAEPPAQGVKELAVRPHNPYLIITCTSHYERFTMSGMGCIRNGVHAKSGTWCAAQYSYSKMTR